MAKCPTCKKEWKWDWEQDAYRDEEGVYAGEVILKNSSELIGMQVCGCEQILCFTAATPSGEDVFNCPEWATVDWDSKEHAYFEKK